jgi:hypothetical protein
MEEIASGVTRHVYAAKPASGANARLAMSDPTMNFIFGYLLDESCIK